VLKCEREPGTSVIPVCKQRAKGGPLREQGSVELITRFHRRVGRTATLDDIASLGSARLALHVLEGNDPATVEHTTISQQINPPSATAALTLPVGLVEASTKLGMGPARRVALDTPRPHRLENPRVVEVIGSAQAAPEHLAAHGLRIWLGSAALPRSRPASQGPATMWAPRATPWDPPQAGRLYPPAHGTPRWWGEPSTNRQSIEPNKTLPLSWGCVTRYKGLPP
jgi:hypothetical protein